MNAKAYFVIALSVCLFIGGFGLWLSPAHAAQVALVSFEPTTLNLRPGDQADIKLLLTGVEEMYGLEFHLQFDPDLLEVVDQESGKEGTQIGSGDLLKDGFVAVNNTDNSTGKIDFALTLLNPAPPVSGEGVLAVIRLKAKSVGSTSIHIDNVILATREGYEIPSEWLDGNIVISESAPALENVETTSSDQVDPLIIITAILGAVIFMAALIIFVIALRKRRE